MKYFFVREFYSCKRFNNFSAKQFPDTCVVSGELNQTAIPFKNLIKYYKTVIICCENALSVCVRILTV